MSVDFPNGRQKLRWPTFQSMQAFLVVVPHLYQVNGKTVPPGVSHVICTKDGNFVLRCDTRTHRQSFNFYPYR